MRSCITTTTAGPARLLALLLVCALLAACGGPEPTPVYLVVTRAPATPTGAPPTLAPEPAPTRDEVAFEAYEHPSGAFRLDLPEGAAVAADEEGISISVDGSKLLVRFTVPPEPLAGDGLKAAIPALVDTVLVEGGLIASYSDLEIQGNQAGDAASGRMAVVTDEFGEGEAEAMLWQVEHVLYTMILVTPDYAAARSFWTRAMDSLAPSVERVPLPAEVPPTPGSVEPTVTLIPQASPTTEPPPPTDTPRPQPTDTPRPRPTDTPRPQPTSPPAPPPASGQGCYLFENEIPAELTVTFTARDRQWSDTFKVPANGTREYCLAPGRYTYTIDAPPPWSSTNGELTVNPGDRYRWPIRGG